MVIALQLQQQPTRPPTGFRSIPLGTKDREGRVAFTLWRAASEKGTPRLCSHCEVSASAQPLLQHHKGMSCSSSLPTFRALGDAATGGGKAGGGGLSGNAHKRAVGESPESAIGLSQFQSPAPCKTGSKRPLELFLSLSFLNCKR